MKNLELCGIRSVNLVRGISNISEVLLVDDHIFVVMDQLLYRYDKDGFNRICITETHKYLTGLVYLVDEDIIFYGTGKCFVYYGVSSKDIEVKETVFEFVTVKWSPAQRRFAVVTVKGEVVVYVAEHFCEEFYAAGSSLITNSVSGSIAVGWGSSDSQFHDSTEKRKASPSRQPEEIVKNIIDKEIRIEWQDNNSSFLVNYWSAGKRHVKIYNLPCVPVYSTGDVDGLQVPTSWKAKGNMIACPVYDGTYRIAILETNGWLTQSLELYDQIEVTDLEWDATGELLAVCQKCEDATYLSLYKISNSHWYLKQRLVFDKSNPMIKFTWTNLHERDFYEFTVATTKEIVVYQFINKVHRHASPLDEHGTCAVIDGAQLLVYYLSNDTVSPPNANEVVTFKSPISHVLFHNMCYEVLVVDCTGLLYHCTYKHKNFAIIAEVNLEIPVALDQFPFTIHHYFWKTNMQLSVIATNAGSTREHCIKFTSDLQYDSQHFINSNLNHISCIGLTRQVMTVHDKVVVKIDDNFVDDFTNHFIMKIESFIVEDASLIFSLTLNNTLYIDNLPFAKNITSYLVHGGYLFFTADKSIYCVRMLKAELQAASKDGKLAEEIDAREIEKGAVLISANPANRYLLLQTPRGSVEVTNCQTVIIDEIEWLLKKGKWELGYDLMRTEKLNSNLLVDLDFDRFLNSILEFLTSVNGGNGKLINFLIELSDENVLNTMYKNCHFTSKTTAKKKARVCRAIIACVERLDLKAYVKVGVVAKFQLCGIDCTMNYLKYFFYTKENVIVATGLECLKAFVSYDKICEWALLSYDAEFTSFVYRYSAIDPKIYRPVLSSFAACKTDSLRCFKINDYLKKYEEALVYFTKTLDLEKGMDDEPSRIATLQPVLDYARKHNITPYLYEMSRTTNFFFREISSMYAGYLRGEGMHKEAAIVYENAGFHEEAFVQYKFANLWQDAIIALGSVRVSEAQKIIYLNELAENLEKNEKFQEASNIYEVHIQDYDKAISVLIKGNSYRKAVDVAEKVERFDLIDTEIKVPFFEYVEVMLKKFKSIRTVFNERKSRLRQVRTVKTLEFGDADLTDIVQQSSEEPSTSSGSVFGQSFKSMRSRETSLSIRSSRKEQLKMIDTREGGVYEDIALIRVLYETITEVFALGPEVHDLCRLLVFYKNVKEAKYLQNSLQNLQYEMINSFEEIWPSQLYAMDITMPESLALKHNMEFLDVKYRTHPDIPTEPWKVQFSDD